jgi:hypothetical protein
MNREKVLNVLCADCMIKQECTEKIKNKVELSDREDYLYAFCTKFMSGFLYKHIFEEKKLEGGYWKGIPVPINK